MRTARPTARRPGGFTLVEVIITLVIAAIALAAATPGFGALLEKQRLDGAAARLTSDIQFARAEAARRGESVRLSLHGSQGGCYLLHTGARAACNCSEDGAFSCGSGAEALKAVGMGSDAAVRLTGDVASILFDPLHGTSTPTGTLTLTAASGRSILDIVNLMGRVHTCSPSTTAPAVPGYAVC